MASRQIKLPTREMGEVRLVLIEEENGSWGEWDLLRGTVFGDQFSQVPRETLDHALRGWSYPFSNALGIPPEGALKKIPKESRQCHRRSICPLYDPKICFPESLNMPWCFEPDGVEPLEVRTLATRAIEHWRDRVYLVVVKE